MKAYLLITIFIFLAFTSIYSQCDAPIVESWTAPDITNFTVNFTPPEGALSYTLTIYGRLWKQDFGASTPDNPDRQYNNWNEYGKF